DGRELPAALVPAADFASLAWATTAWHGEAVVYAGQGTRDHLRAAVELLSPDRARRTVFAHTGWRQVGGGWHYLHAGGAAGRRGPAAGAAVPLPPPLAGSLLPAPPPPAPPWKVAFPGELGESAKRDAAGLQEAVRSSLALLGLGPGRLTFPLLAAAYR